MSGKLGRIDHNSVSPDIYYRKDEWVKKLTKGKFNEFSFMMVDEGDYLYHYALNYISTFHEKLVKKRGDTVIKDLEVGGASPWNFFAEFTGYGYHGLEEDDEEEVEAEKDEKEQETNKKKEGGKPEEEEEEEEDFEIDSEKEDEEKNAKNAKKTKKKKNKKKKPLTNVKTGFGEFVLTYKKHTIYCIHKEVAGVSSNGKPYRLLVFFKKGRNEKKVLGKFMEFLAEKNKDEPVTQDYVSVYRYNIQNNYWQNAYNARARPVQSVVLPKPTKKKLLDDVKDFVDKETKKWYFEKGIPYKRSYLFYGVPGSGKTSIISVLAGEYNKPICYLSPTDPMMTDEVLKNAIISAPEGGIIIFEDVDGLFSKDRKSTVSNHLTFSGLLNALDGVGSGFGQIFILTTNFRDRLDNALIRNGRVDLQIEFKHVIPEQVEEMFGLFYADADEKAKIHFRERVFELIEKVSKEPCLSAAMLQNFFITHRRCTFDQAIDQVEDLIVDVKNAISDAKNREEKEKEEKAKENEKKAKENGEVV